MRTSGFRRQLMNNRPEHRSVLSQDVVELLAPTPGALVLDCTVGGGGHAALLLERSQPGGRLIGIDRDTVALARAAERLAPYGSDIQLLHGNYGDALDLVDARSLKEASVVLADLGVSSFHLDDPGRGFTLRDPLAPLDMRMDQAAPPRPAPRASLPVEEGLAQLEGCTAETIVNGASLELLRELLWRYGEVRESTSVARCIVRARERAPLATAGDLLDVLPGPTGGPRRASLASRVFQGLRIAINDELGALRRLLERVLPALSSGTRVGIISFHSLEDRMVKQHFRALARDCTCPPQQPICTCGGDRSTIRLLTPRAVRASDEEVALNPRSRSASLRVAQIR